MVGVTLQIEALEGVPPSTAQKDLYPSGVPYMVNGEDCLRNRETLPGQQGKAQRESDQKRPRAKQDENACSVNKPQCTLLFLSLGIKL